MGKGLDRKKWFRSGPAGKDRSGTGRKKAQGDGGGKAQESGWEKARENGWEIVRKQSRKKSTRIWQWIAAGAIVSLAAISCYGLRKSYGGIRISNAGQISEVIRQTMQHRSYSVKISFLARTLKRDEVADMTARLISDAFYESSDPKGGDYLRYQYGGYELKHSVEKKFLRYQYHIRVIPAYYTTAAQEEKVDELVSEAVRQSPFWTGPAESREDGKNALHSQPDGPEGEDGSWQAGPQEDAETSEEQLEQIRWVHDYICDTVEYDTIHRHMPGSRHIQSTAYGALVYHRALCQGYAVLCYRLLKELGIDARIIMGKARVAGEWERHAWNIVKLDGKYYDLDVTLDDVNGSDDYFLKTDAEFLKDHQRDEEYESGEYHE